MKKSRVYFVILAFLATFGCRVLGETPRSTATLTPTSLSGLPTPTSPMAMETRVPAPPKERLSPFSVDWSKPFAGQMMDGTTLALTAWEPQSYQGEDISLPLSLSQVANVEVLANLTSEQQAFLVKNGFVILHSQEVQFGDIRAETAKRNGQPYYLTTDAAFHALHLLFDDLLKSLEREHFRPQMIAITQAALDQVAADYPSAANTSLAGDMEQSLAYLSVALKLFDSEAEIDPAVADIVAQQVEQIIAADGRAKSALFPNFEDDYGAYKPVGHYAGDPDLEAYFRGMTWYGRMHFLLQNPDDPNFVPSRLPLIITLALRRAQVDGQPAADVWAEMHKTLTFVVGPSDDAGPLEYGILMDAVYGDNPGVDDLADETLWQEFLSRSDQLPAPEINSLFVVSTVDLEPTKGWRFMGQRFTLDGMILQNVIFDRVEPKPDNTRREFPSGLDVMAAFGSQPALLELENQGVTEFPNYSEQLEMMQQAVQAQPASQWLGRFYDSWLYAFFPVIQAKDAAYPAYMQTSAWGYKDLNAALGSWAELKHDTVLYTKMPERAGGGGPPMSGPAPSYVEPNPEAFYRMAYMASSLSCGLQNRVLYMPCILEDTTGGYLGYADPYPYIMAMGALGARFEELGDIAAKELAGQPLDADDTYTITSCLGMQECVNTDTVYNQPNSEMPKVPVIAAVSGSDDSVLEVGVGGVDRIYVVVPLEGRWEVAQGGVFSYYEFTQPRDQRLTDDEWRAKLAAGEVELPSWASNLVLPGGEPTEALFFRIGDVYIITEEGIDLNVRDQPSVNANVLTQLEPDAYVGIVDGPIMADRYTWWKFEIILGDEPLSGWAVEDQVWYERSYLE
ncbi:MAG: DUF3160 domain-containing protein [Anaerolineales bacterium]|nr:DUF3160 domain-containing protein [Anaerolineales bacterium]